ncbi:MAG: DNA-directed RNA polymerase specialized sigma24 family protein [Planctomycetota bacterium]|jgi:DNA-directed RNA polymerase specialized sigma24 family protein
MLPRPDNFATTRWSLVHRARRDGDKAARAALAELCQTYWAPVHHYVLRRGYSEDEARDHTQAFFTSLIEGGDFDAVDPQRGRFRAWLLGCANHFLANAEHHRQAWKRGGSHQVLSLDFDSVRGVAVTDAKAESPEAAFEREWALAVLAKVLVELEQEYRGAGQAELFAALRPRLLPGEDCAPFQELASRFGRSAGALKTAAHRMRRRYGELLRRGVGDTLEDASGVEGEIQGLFDALSSG